MPQPSSVNRSRCQVWGPGWSTSNTRIWEASSGSRWAKVSRARSTGWTPTWPSALHRGRRPAAPRGSQHRDPGPGEFADIVGFRADLLDCPVGDLPSQQPALTLAGGRPVHDPDGLLGSAAEYRAGADQILNGLNHGPFGEKELLHPERALALRSEPGDAAPRALSRVMRSIMSGKRALCSRPGSGSGPGRPGQASR
jgi:hypothetical protein